MSSQHRDVMPEKLCVIMKGVVSYKTEDMAGAVRDAVYCNLSAPRAPNAVEHRKVYWKCLKSRALESFCS